MDCYILLFQQSIPLRHKEIHLINVPAAVRYFYDLISALVSDKMRSRVKVWICILMNKFLVIDYNIHYLYSYTIQTNEMHISYINIIIFYFLYVFYLMLLQSSRSSLPTILFILMHVKSIIPNCIYNRLPEDKPSCSKHVEDIKKIKN